MNGIMDIFFSLQLQKSKSSRKRSLASTAVCRVRARTRASRTSRTKSRRETVTTASSLSAQGTKTMISTRSETSLTTTRRMVRLVMESVEVEFYKKKAFSILISYSKSLCRPFPLDPWLIRKEPKKGKEKKKKKRRKSIDPDSIQSALLASGLGSTRPAFTAPVNPPSAPATGKHVTIRQSRTIAL